MIEWFEMNFNWRISYVNQSWRRNVKKWAGVVDVGVVDVEVEEVGVVDVVELAGGETATVADGCSVWAWLAAFLGANTVNQTIKKTIPAMRSKASAIRKIANGLLLTHRRPNLADKLGLGT